MAEDNKENKIDSIPKKPVHSANIETYAGDMADVLKGGDEGGMVKKIIHGEEEYEAERKKLSPASKINRIFLILGILFIILSVTLISYFFYKNINNTVPVVLQPTPLVFSDKNVTLDISGFNKDKIINIISNEINRTSVAVGGLEGISLTENKKNVGLREFISLIGASFSPVKNISIVGDNFFMGSVLTGLKSSSPTAGDFFMLLKMRSIPDIFDSLKAWEPNMLNDLHGFLGINVGSDTNYLFQKNFEDGIIDNKNARILYDNNNNIVLMYVFVDDNSVVITGSEQAADEVITRLSSGQVQQ